MFITDLLESNKIPREGEILQNHKNQCSFNMLIWFVLVILGVHLHVLYCTGNWIWGFSMKAWLKCGEYLLSGANVQRERQLLGVQGVYSPLSPWETGSTTTVGIVVQRCSNSLTSAHVLLSSLGQLTISNEMSVIPTVVLLCLGTDNILKAMRLQHRLANRLAWQLVGSVDVAPMGVEVWPLSMLIVNYILRGFKCNLR